MRIVRLSPIAVVVALASSAPSTQQSVIPELGAALDRCWADPIIPMLLPSDDLCRDEAKGVARAIDPQACATDTPACVELEEKIISDYAKFRPHDGRRWQEARAPR